MIRTANYFLQSWPQILLLAAGVFSSRQKLGCYSKSMEQMFERLPFIQWEAAGQCRTVHEFQETGCATCWKNSTASFKADTCDSRTLSTPAGCGSIGSSAPRVIQPCTISQLMINQETHQSPSPYNKYWQVLSSDNAEWRIVKSTSANTTGGTKTETTLKNMKTPHFPKPRNFRNTPTCSKDMQLPPSLWTRLQVLPQFNKPKRRTTNIIRLDCKCSWQNLYDSTSCVPHLLLSMAYRHINNPMVNHSFGAQLLKHRRFALVSSAADSALLSPNLHPPAKWEIYQGRGNTWRFPNYLIYTFVRNNFDIFWPNVWTRMGLWTFQNPDIAASTKCQKQILENSCGHSKPKSLRSKIVNGGSFSEWGEHCRRPTIKDGWNPTAPRNDPVELALTAR